MQLQPMASSPDGLISARYAVITKTPGWEALTTRGGGSRHCWHCSMPHSLLSVSQPPEERPRPELPPHPAPDQSDRPGNNWRGNGAPDWGGGGGHGKGGGSTRLGPAGSGLQQGSEPGEPRASEWQAGDTRALDEHGEPPEEGPREVGSSRKANLGLWPVACGLGGSCYCNDLLLIWCMYH